MAFRLPAQIATLLVALVLVVAAVLAGTTILTGAMRIEEAVLASQEHVGLGLLQGARIHLDNAHTSLDAAAKVLGDTGVPTQGSDDGALLLDSMVAAHSLFVAVFVVDDEGTRLKRPVGFPLPESYHPGMETERFHFGPDNILLAADVASEEAGCCRLVGLVTAAPFQDRLFVAIESLAAGTQGVLRAANGTVVAASSGWAEVEPALEMHSTGKQGTLLASSGSDKDTDLSFWIAGPASQTTPLVAALATATIVPTLVLVVAAGAGGVAASSRILRPLGNLQDATARIAKGELSARARPGGAPDLKEVADRFNQMADALQADRERLQRFQEHLEELVKERTRELEEKRRDMELFFYGVSHDMKSPVLTIRNYTQLVRRDAAAEVAERLEMVDVAGRNLAGLIDQLLLYASMDRERPSMQEVRLGAVVQQAIEHIHRDAESAHINVIAQGDAMTAKTDPERLQRALVNLLENALRYGGDSATEVRITWGHGQDGASWWLQVADDGAGMPEHIKAELWRPFGKHRTRGGHQGGHGLGLSIVHRITDSLGGQVTLEPAGRTGTVFKLTFDAMTP